MTTPILPPSALPGQPVAATSPARDAGRWLVALADPEWLPCLAVSLAPAAAALALGEALLPFARRVAGCGFEAAFASDAALAAGLVLWRGRACHERIAREAGLPYTYPFAARIP